MFSRDLGKEVPEQSYIDRLRHFSYIVRENASHNDLSVYYNFYHIIIK